MLSAVPRERRQERVGAARHGHEGAAAAAVRAAARQARARPARHRARAPGMTRALCVFG